MNYNNPKQIETALFLLHNKIQKQEKDDTEFLYIYQTPKKILLERSGNFNHPFEDSKNIYIIRTRETEKPRKVRDRLFPEGSLIIIAKRNITDDRRLIDVLYDSVKEILNPESVNHISKNESGLYIYGFKILTLNTWVFDNNEYAEMILVSDYIDEMKPYCVESNYLGFAPFIKNDIDIVEQLKKNCTRFWRNKL